MKIFFFTVLVFCCISYNYAQSILGTIHTPINEVVPQVLVTIPAIKKFTFSDSEGKFQFTNISSGKYLIEFTRIGFMNEVKTIVLSNSDIELEILLQHSPIEIPTVTVTSNTQPSTIFNNSNTVTVIKGDELELNRGQSVMQTLDWSPGVSLFSGSMLSIKPVLRGLTAQRIVIASDGKRIESQNWDEPQSSEIDVLDVENIEIVHGPMSVLFGSDALGGVVNVLRNDIFNISHYHLLDGNASINVFSNNTQGSANLTLFGSKDNYFYRTNFSGRYAGDYSSPSGTTSTGKKVSSGSVFNSGAQEFDASARFGMIKKWGTLEVDYSHFGQLYFISPEPGRKEYELNIHTNSYDSLPAAPKQEILHELLSGKLTAPISFGKIEINTSLQYNSRKEEGVAESDADEVLKEEKGIKPEALMDLYTFSFDTRLHHQPIGVFNGTVGGAIVAQRNQTLGINAIIPNYTATTISGFIYEEAEISSLFSIAAGFRGDNKTMTVSANDSLLNPYQELQYRSLNGSAGIVFRPVESFVVASHFSTGWRSPIASELFTRGKDEGTIRYKIGNPSLQPELARSSEISFRFQQTMIRAELNLFNTSIQDYIYLDPTGTTISGLPVFSYRQTNAILRGGEFFAEIYLTDAFGFTVGYDYLESRNETLHSPLPLQPANKAKIGIQVHVLDNPSESENGFVIQKLSVITRTKYVMVQNKVTALETVSPHYSLFDLGIIGKCSYNKKPISIYLLCENILNTSYYDHLSRYKEYALNPGLGISLKATVPFSLIN